MTKMLGYRFVIVSSSDVLQMTAEKGINTVGGLSDVLDGTFFALNQIDNIITLTIDFFADMIEFLSGGAKESVSINHIRTRSTWFVAWVASRF